MFYALFAFCILILLLGASSQTYCQNKVSTCQPPLTSIQVAFFYTIYGYLGIPIQRTLFSFLPIPLFMLLYILLALSMNLFANQIYSFFPHRINSYISSFSSFIYTCFIPLEKLSSHHHEAVTVSPKTELTEAVFSFDKLIVREVMVPKIDVFAIQEDLLISQVFPKLVEEGYSRVPVYKKTIDQITGVLLVKDLLKQSLHASQADMPVSAIMKTPLFTPEIKKASQLLQEFRQQHRHLAIVVNEYGYTEGIVTMEDIIEEIFGEILDEYDGQEDLPYKKIGNSWIVDGRMNISTAEELFHFKIDHEHSYDTLGGHVFHKAGIVPKKGMKLHYENFDVEILSCSERSIGKLKITPLKNVSPTEPRLPKTH